MNVCSDGRDIQRHSLHIGNLLGGHVADAGEQIRSAPNGTPPKFDVKGENVNNLNHVYPCVGTWPSSIVAPMRCPFVEFTP